MQITGHAPDIRITAVEEKLDLAQDAITAAKARSIHADIWFRAIALLVVLALFWWLNRTVMEFVREVFASDTSGHATAAADSRVVTSNVVMSLIAASAVQTGVGFIAIMRYLFPNRDGKSE